MEIGKIKCDIMIFGLGFIIIDVGVKVIVCVLKYVDVILRNLIF